MFVFNRPLGAVAAGLGVALLVVCLDGLSHPLEVQRDARASDTPATLRAAGTAVWFDQSELRVVDVWDQKIRRQIHDCALFVPIVSANTASRREGYFRLEWDLADQRTHMMARDRSL